MTKREMFEAIKAELTNEDMINFIDKEITMLDKRKESSDKARAKKNAEREKLIEQVLDVLAAADKPLPTMSIAMALGVSTQKITPVMTALENEKRVFYTLGKNKRRFFSLQEDATVIELPNEEVEAA